MRSILKLSVVLLSGILIIATACKKKKIDTPDSPSTTSFDTKGLLANYANNLIVPAYKTLGYSVASLDSAVNTFNSVSNATTLSNLQNAFKNAYLNWQSCSEFQFGPADQQYLRENVNTFPTDTTQIKSNITANSYNLATLVNLSAKGFPGLDYLLFGIGSNNTAILAQYTTSSNAANRKQYLADLSADLKTTVNAVVNAWSASYVNTFINAAGTDIGSSIGQLINAMDFDMEVLKNDKLGIPLGKQSMGTLYPAKTEGYYSGISVQLALAQLKAIQNIYAGKGTQGDGSGLDDYLVSIKAQYTSGTLNDVINSRFATAVTDLGTVPDPLSSTIQSDITAANTAYSDVQKLVVLLKTDLPSSMGVLITYDDTDGD